MAAVRWSLQCWEELAGDWADQKGNKYTLTPDRDLLVDELYSYTVYTRRLDGENRTTKSLIYYLDNEVCWGEHGQFRLRQHGAKGKRAGTIITHIGWHSVCKKCGSVAKEATFAWTRKGEGPLPPPPTKPPPSHHRARQSEEPQRRLLIRSDGRRLVETDAPASRHRDIRRA